MKTLALCLWKEWRDQRLVLLGLLAGTLLLFGMAKIALPQGVLESSSFRDIALFSCLGLAVLVFASDLVCGEERRGHLRLLRRTPRGLLPVFLAKTAWMAGAVACLGAWGWLGAGLVSGIYASLPWLRLCTGVAIAAGAWGVAASCWLPRGALAVPAAGLVLGLLALPVYLVYEAYAGLEPPRGAVTGFAVFLAAAALPVGWLGFAVGKRFERGLWPSAWRGLLTTLLFFVPAYGYTALDVREWHWFDPTDPRVVLHGGYLGVGGRYIFLNAHMGDRVPPSHAFVVDLETGAWRKAGQPNDRFLPVGEPSLREWTERRTRPVRAVALMDMRATQLDEGASRGRRGWMHYYDAATAEVVKRGWSDMRHPEVEALGPRTPSYVPAGYEPVARRGLGYSAWRERKSCYYDPFRDRIYEPFPNLRQVLIRPGRWLALRDGVWVFFDPDTREESAAPNAPRALDWMLDDGRVVSGGTVWDPESGEQRRVDDWACGAWLEARTPGGAYVVGFIGRDSPHARHARLDPETLALSWFDGIKDVPFADFVLVAVLDEETLLGIHDHRFLVKVRCGTAEREVLWPR